MPRYYFDSRDDGRRFRDDDGVELDNLDAAKELAARTLAEQALEVLPASSEWSLGLDVRDDTGHVLFTTGLTFKTVAGGRIG